MTGNLTQLLSFASVMKSIGGVVLAVVILLAMVTIHEFGHYLAGKALNFKINEFSVGFGPALFKKRNKKTGELFALRLIPLGGYCAFEGEDDTVDAGEKGRGRDDRGAVLRKDEIKEDKDIDGKSDAVIEFCKRNEKYRRRGAGGSYFAGYGDDPRIRALPCG